jgi:hypothetical protein
MNKSEIYNIISKLDNGSHPSNQLQGVDEALVELFERELEKYKEALIWCSAASDFQVGGKAREGWKRLCQPLIGYAQAEFSENVEDIKPPKQPHEWDWDAEEGKTHYYGDGHPEHSNAEPKQEGWRERFDQEVHWEDGTFGSYAYVKDFAPFIAKEIAHAYERGKGDGIREEAIGCDKHCEEARAAGYENGYQEGLNLRKEYNDPDLIAKVEREAREDEREKLKHPLTATELSIMENTAENTRKTIANIRLQALNDAKEAIKRMAGDTLFTKSQVIQALERLQKNENRF